MNARKAHKIWLKWLRGYEYRQSTWKAAFEKAKSWYLRASGRIGDFDNYIKEGHWTERDQNTYARLRRRKSTP
jgi:hypothetical protein